MTRSRDKSDLCDRSARPQTFCRLHRLCRASGKEISHGIFARPGDERKRGENPTRRLTTRLGLLLLLPSLAWGQSAQVNLSQFSHGLVNPPIGTGVGQIPQIINFQSTRPGWVLQNYTSGSAQGGFAVSRGAPSSTDSFDLGCLRTPTFSGGSAANVNKCLFVGTTTVAGITSNEWNAVFKMDNFGTSTDASQNLALYAQALKESTGHTWATTFELRDFTQDPPPGSAVTTEFDMFANDTDSNVGRVVIDVVGGMRPGGDGVAPTVNYGVRVGPQFNLSTNATFVTGYYFYGNFAGTNASAYSNAATCLSGTCNSFFDSGTSTYGLNMGGTYSSGFLFARDNAPLIWNSAQTITQKWSSANSCIQFSLSAVGFACLASTGSSFTAASGVALTANGSGAAAALDVESAANTRIAQFNTTASGGFIVYERGGTIKAWLGDASQLVSGTLDDIALRSTAGINLASGGAVTQLYLASSGAKEDVGTQFTVASGTGTCATTSTLHGGSQAGDLKCTTAGTAASTVTLTLPATKTAYACYGRDVTTPTTVTQTGAISTTSVTLTLTSVTANDVIQFGCGLGY